MRNRERQIGRELSGRAGGPRLVRRDDRQLRRREREVLPVAVLVDAVSRDVARAGMDAGIEVVAIAAAEPPGVAVVVAIAEALQAAERRLREDPAVEHDSPHGTSSHA